MRTIGRKWPSRHQRGDRQAMCSYCGVQWLRSQLTRDESGNLVCPDEGDGKDSLQLDRLNSEGASRFRGRQLDGDEGGAWDNDVTVPSPAQDLANTIGKVTFG